VDDFSIPHLIERYDGEIRLDKSVLQGNTGSGKTIMVCSCNDLFQEGTPDEIVLKVLAACRAYPENTYLFQTKNPKRLQSFMEYYPPNAIFGTTIESNKDSIVSEYSKAPPILERMSAMMDLRVSIAKNPPENAESWKLMLSIEPVMDFDVDELSKIVKLIKPSYVSIGANSSLNKITLPEPSESKILNLHYAINPITNVRLKPNLKRLLPNTTGVEFAG
jgi:hypothetical protein